MWKKALAVLIGAVIGCWFYDDFDPESLRGKRVLITGASTGIGEQIAYHYARLGAKVVVTSRRAKSLQQVVDRCREVGEKDGTYEFVAADMKDINAPKYVIKEAIRHLGGLDILVLNHIRIMPLGEWMGTPDNFTKLQDVFDINFRAYVHLASHAFQELEKNSGSIIVLSSVAGKTSVPFVTSYSSSKFALDGFFSSWRQELKMRQSGVSITLCVIGFIGTENAVTKLDNFGEHFLLKVMTPASPSDCALAIIRGGAQRLREVYYPYLDSRLPLLFRDWFPGILEATSRYISAPSHYNTP